MKHVLLAGSLLLGTSMGWALGAPSELELTKIEESAAADRFTFRVAVPAVETSGSPEDAEVLVRGLETREMRSGYPDLPTRTVLVAIPADVTPVLEVHAGAERVTRGVTPRGALVRTVNPAFEDEGALRFDGTEAEPEDPFLEERVKDPLVYGGEETVPREIAWLGKVGVLRSQRYVEVHLAPVRYDPGLPGLRVTDSIEVTVRFDGDSRVRTTSRPEAVFEGVYRNAFVNYGQGTTFRLGAGVAPIRGAEPAPLISGPLYRIRIRANGVVRLDHTQMSATPFVGQPLSTWKLTSRGVEVPLQIQDDGDDVLEPGEWVQFYGQALDDEPKTVVNTDLPGSDDLWEMRDFSDENIYFLGVESGARSRVPVRPSTPTNTRVPPTSFPTVLHAEADEAFKPLDGGDPWFWLPFLCFGCGGLAVTSRIDNLAVPGLASGTQPVHVTVRLRGNSENSNVFPDHHTRITLSNASDVLTTNDDDGTFDGRKIYTHDFTWTYPGSGPQATDPLIVKTETLGAGTKNEVIADWIEIAYQRTFAAVGDTLRFEWPNADSEFVVSGLASSAPLVYELTDHVGTTGILSPVRLTSYSVSGAGPFSIRFRVDVTGSLPALAPRRFLVSGVVAAPAPADFTPDTVSTLRSTSNQADLIVIASPLVLDTSNGSGLDNLLGLRAAQGIVSKIVLIEDVQDEFGDGLAGPLAIKNFLRFVISTNPGEGWASPKPTYVLLLGDGSFDYKGGTASGNYVPTQILIKNDRSVAYYASDNVMADVVGDDQLADLVIGRVSARNQAEANLVLQKIYDYENNPPAGNWRHHALFISDRGKTLTPLPGCDAIEGADFERVNDDSEAFMARPPYSSRKLRYMSDYCSPAACPCAAGANQMRNAIKSAVNGTDGFSDGAAIVQYVGHGNYEWWSDDAFFDDYPPQHDTGSLVNGVRLPWLMVHTCLTGGFHQISDVSMGEDWLKRSGGGAVAVFGPSGLDFTYIADQVADSVWSDLFGPPKRRDVATPILDALVRLCSQGATDTCQHYTYLGDPAMSLVLPSVDPPGVPVPVPGSLRVDLSWAASTTPGATYKIYRGTKLTPAPNYVLIASNVAGTVYADLDPALQNETTYYYYAVAVDAGSFESAWSNFNGDCAVNGPDCAKATPTNPFPPATPTGVAVIDTEKGGGLRVSWSPNPERDLKSYTIWFGTTPGSFGSHADAPANATSLGLSGLVNGQRYYVAVSATNLSLHTSPLSSEVNAVPTNVQGIRSPSFIETLHVQRSGANAVLTWSAVTTDIYGKPTTIASYEVFRGTSPDFLPSLANRIGTSPTPSFTDNGAMVGPSYYYLVRAVDAAGNQGGLGFDLPDGISGLRISRAGGILTLSWSPVTTTFGGDTTRIDHYNVYVSGSAFTRAQIRDGVVPVSTTTTGTSIQIGPPAPNQYYSVLAVDTKGNLSPF